MSNTVRRSRELARGDLDHNDARYRKLFADIQEGFFIAELVRDSGGRAVDFIFLDVNEAFTRQSGRAPQQVLGRRISETIPEFPRSVLKHYGAVVETGKPVAFDLEIAAPERRSYEVRAHPLGGARFAVLFLEITERKRFEKALEESRASLNAIVNSVDQMIWSTRPDGYHEFFNRRWYDYTGAAPGTTDGDAWAALLHPDDRARTFERWHRSLATGEPYEAEYRVKHRSGTYRWVLGRARPVRNEAGEITRWMGTCTDIDELRRLEEALRASEERFRTLYEAQKTAHLVLSRDLMIEEVSPAYLEITQTRREDLIGKPLFEAFPENPDDPAASWARNLRASIERVLETQAPDRMPVQKYEIRGPSGAFEARWWAPLCLPVFGDDGAVRHIIYQVEDVTAEMIERQKAAEAQAGEAWFREIADTIPGLVFEANLQAGNTYVNQQYCDYTGLPFEALLGNGWEQVVHPDDRDRAIDTWVEAAHSGRSFEMEVRLRRADGAWRWFMLRVSVMRGRNGRFERGIGVCTDIDDARRAHDALRESEQQFRSLAESLPQLVWMADSRGWIYWYNRRWYEYTGTTPEEMLGWGWQKLHHPDHVARVTQRIQRAWDTGEPWEDIFPLRGADGRYRWFLSRATPMKDSENRVMRWLGTCTDITEKQNLEDLQKTLIHEISHRVKNSLALVSSLLAVQARTLDGAAREALQDASARVHAMAGVHDQLWRQAGTQEVDLAPFIQNLTASIATSAPRHKTVVEAEPAVVSADLAIPLGLFLNELLTNAYKYAYPENVGGEVRVRGVHIEGDSYRLEVTDYGKGLPAGFDIAKARHSLGMRIVASLSEQLGGALTVEALHPGTQFALIFPLPAKHV